MIVLWRYVSLLVAVYYVWHVQPYASLTCILYAGEARLHPTTMTCIPHDITTLGDKITHPLGRFSEPGFSTTERAY